jgi:uncharacterized protein YdeI (BOF family)
MKFLKTATIAALALILAMAFSACSKQAETDTQTSEGYGTETPPADQPAASAESQPPEPAPVAEKPAAKKPTSTKTPTPPTPATPASVAKTYEIPVGTMFDVAISTPMSTKTSNVGDAIEGKLVTPITKDGFVIADAGSSVRGEISDVKRASRAKSAEDRASLTLVFTTMQTAAGEKSLHATVTNTEGKLVAASTSTRDKLIIAGSTVAGAITGKIAGKDTKATVIGAVGGAVVGTGIVLASKGHELEIPEGAKVSLRVDQPITVVSK